MTSNNPGTRKVGRRPRRRQVGEVQRSNCGNARGQEVSGPEVVKLELQGKFSDEVTWTSLGVAVGQTSVGSFCFYGKPRESC